MADKSDEVVVLEARLMAALKRIEAGVAKWPAPIETPAPVVEAEAPSAEVDDEVDHTDEPELALEMAVDAAANETDDIASLKAKLEEERTANAQLEQRVRQIRRKQDGRVKELEAKLQIAQGEAEDAEKQTAKLRRSNEDLRHALRALEDSVAESAPDAHLINRAMMAELESLRTERAADAAEIGDLISILEPMVDTEATNA